jgi:hypothetical protein
MRKTAFLLLLVFMFWGCATFSQNYKQGTEAAMNKNWDEAIKFYEQAVLENPNNSVYRMALARAKLAASSVHLIEARSR